VRVTGFDGNQMLAKGQGGYVSFTKQPHLLGQLITFSSLFEKFIHSVQSAHFFCNRRSDELIE